MSEREEAAEKIGEYRKTIDDIDLKLLQLLNTRADQSLAIRALKPAAGMTSVYDPEREGRIVKRLESLNEGPLRASDIEEIYATLLKVMKGIPGGGAGK